MLSGVFSRPLDPSEVYFELVGRTWPMIALCAIEFDEALTAERVGQAWDRLAMQVPVVGAHVERTSGRDARLVFETSGETASVTRYDDVASAWTELSVTPVDIENGPMVRCSLVESDSGATVVITSHHAVMDGRCLADLALLFAEVMVDGSDVGGHALSEPTLPLHGGGQEAPLADMLATARQVRDEDGFVGAAEGFDWHDPLLDPPRDIGFALFDLSEGETAGLLAWARAQEATVQGALSAALLAAATAVSPGSTRIGLSTSVDLRSRFEEPQHGSIGQAAGVISGSYDTGETKGEIARLISRDIRRRFDRGEAELLYALSGAGRFPVDHTTDRVIRRWVAEATPTLCISNMGVVTGPAPASLRRLSVGLAPTPNQAVYVAASTFRGALSLTVGYDRNRLRINADEFASTVHSQVIELARAGEHVEPVR